MAGLSDAENARDLATRARFASGEIDSGQAAGAFGRPVEVSMPRLAWLQLLGWLSADRYEPGSLPWMDGVIAAIEDRIT